MYEGFLPGSRASIIMDLLILAMAVILCVLGYSILQVRKNKNYELHKKIQIICGSTLAIAVVFFEIDVRFFGWQDHAKVSPYYDTILFPVLYFHVVWATLAAFAWGFQIFKALKNIGPNMERSNTYSKFHKKMGWAAVILMAGTSVTGWFFYYMAFVAT